MRKIDKAPVRSPKEALEWLDEHCIGETVPLWVKMSASNALEKQIPKKPNIIHVKYQRRYNDKYLCPVCGKSVDTDCGDPFMDYGLDWCNHCGQAIDWSE